MNELDRFEALSFDCYGTLIDWESGFSAELVPWALEHDVSADAEELLRAVSATETVVQTERPGASYPDVLAEVLRRVGARYGVTVSADEAAAFGRSVRRWPAFADSAEALSRLKSRYRLIILSNVDRESFAASNERLGVEFDVIVTAEDVGAYKPSTKMFAALLEAIADLGVPRDALLHVAESLYHDHTPAKQIGLSTAWIHRRHDKEGFGVTPSPVDPDVRPDWRFTSLADLADAAVPDV